MSGLLPRRRGFGRNGNRVVLRLQTHEIDALRNLLHSMSVLIGTATGQADSEPDIDPLEEILGDTTTLDRPTDPAMLRLFPDAYLDETEASQDFRRFTQRDLADERLARLQTCMDSLDRGGEKVVMTQDEARSWLLVLNDTRLVLGSRLGVSEDHEVMAELAAQDEDVASHLQMYDWLTWLQASAIDVMAAIDLAD